jgi:hypothetical protein
MKPSFLLITNAIRPYHRHNISILSLPSGGSYHFRYGQTYVSRDLRPDLVEGAKGLLVLRDRASGRFLPLRWCRGIRQQDFGEFVFFDFCFTEIFDISEAQRTDAWQKFTPIIQASLPQGTKNDPGTDIGPLVFPLKRGSSLELDKLFDVQASDYRNEDHVRRWLRMVAAVGDLDAYRNEHFYTVSRLYANGLTGPVETLPKKISAGRTGYKLTGRKVYFLELIQVTVPIGPGKGPFEQLKVSFPAGHFEDLRTSWIIDGPYDRATLMFFALPQDVSRLPSLLMLSKLPLSDEDKRIRSHGKSLAASEGITDEGAVLGDPVPPTLLDADIVWGPRAWWLRRVLPSVALIVGISAFLGADWLAARRPLNQIPVEYIRYAAIFAMAWALNSFSSFVSNFKITSSTHTQ